RDIPGIRGLSYRLGVLQRRTGFAVSAAIGYAKERLRRNGSLPDIAAVLEGNTRFLVREVVFVEWNPPPDRELLSIELARKFDCLRAYVVAPEIHESICRNVHVPLLEYHAKNVGIRRALSPWIMATNADAAVGFDIVNRIHESE